MNFPKSVNIILDEFYVLNVLDNGEVIDFANTYSLDIVQLLSKALGFSCKMYSAISGKSGIYAGEFLLEESFMHLMTYPISTGSLTYATEKPNCKSNPLAFVKPFNLSTWIGLLFTILLVACTLRLVYRGKIPLPYALFCISAAFLAQHRNWRPRSPAQKLLVLTWGVGITFLTFSYGSLLFSFLSVPVRDKGINDFNELHEAIIQRKATAAMFRDDMSDISLIASNDEKKKFIGEYLKNHNKLELTLHGNLIQLIKPNFAIIGNRRMLETLFGEGRHFISEDIFNLHYFSIYANYGCGICMIKFNEAIHWIWAAGLNKKIDDEYKFKDALSMSSVHGSNYTSTEYASRPLSLSSLSGAFYFLIIGHLLGTLCFVYEIYSFRCTVRRATLSS